MIMARSVLNCNVPLGLELGIAGLGSNTNTITRRKGKHHPNLWTDEFIQSLTSPYGASVYVERRETLIKEIRDMFKRVGDGDGDGEGEFIPSPYDTAWVAMIPAIDDDWSAPAPARPHFPQTLDWICENQQDDGSWGVDHSYSNFSLADRLLNTLACILPLVTWKTGQQNVTKAVHFIRSHMESMKVQERLPIDFEIVFPELLYQAQLLNLDLPYHLTWLENIRIGRQKRLSKICRETFHTRATSLLYSLEGLQEIVDWKRIMNIQSGDGSFLSSPSSTACAFINTGDIKSLDYLTKTLNKFGNYVPCMYSLNILERLWTVDVVQRLGIDRHVKEEIKVALDYTYRYWNQNVIGDLNTAALGFRTLRFNGYDVSADALQNFKGEDGKFLCCFGPGQAHKELSTMLNLYKASELDFPGESVLKEARAFTSTYLQEAVQEWEELKLEKSQLLMEVEYALKFPWKCNVPRWEARNYIEIFRRHNQRHGRLISGVYMIPIVYSQKMLELATLDYNILQSQHQSELKLISTWWTNSSIFHWDFFRHRHVELYFWWVLSLFEPQFSASRIGFTKLATSFFLIDDIYDTYGTLDELIPFTEGLIRWDTSIIENLPDYMKTSFKFAHEIHSEIASEAEKKHGPIVHKYIHDCWKSYILSYLQEAEWIASNYTPNFDQYLENGMISSGMRVTTMHSLMLMEIPLSDEILKKVDIPSSKFQSLVSLTIRLVDDLRDFQDEQERGELASSIECYMKENLGSTREEAFKYINARIDSCLQELNLEFFKSLDIPPSCRNLYFNAGTRGLLFLFKDVDGLTCSHDKEIKNAIKKVLLEPILV